MSETDHDEAKQPILFLATPRQGAQFLELISNGHPMTVLVVEDLAESAFAQAVDEVRAWSAANPSGAVISLSDEPSLVHASAGVPGASLDAILMTLDKAWARETVLAGLGQHRTATLSEHDTTIPAPSGEPGERVIVKPLEGCASKGIFVADAGDEAPGDVMLSRDWVSSLRVDRLGPAPYPTSTIATVEPYVPADVPRVSVDGFIDAAGNARRSAISDNIYVDGEPERFDHQMFPSRISAAAADVCWALYDTIARRLVDDSDLRNQPFDVEMFVFDDGVNPRAEVMEINARLHPNITPVMQQCLVGGDPIAASFSAPAADATTEGAAFAAGAMFYVWSPKPEDAGPAWDVDAFARSLPDEPDVAFCRFGTPSGSPDGIQCHGWLYLFGDTPQSLRKRARELLPTD